MSSPVSSRRLLILVDGLGPAASGGVVGGLVCQHFQILRSQARARMRTAWRWSWPRARAWL